MIKHIFATTLLIMSLGLVLTNCESQDSTSQPTITNQVDQLNEDQLLEFKLKIIRFVGRKPEDASHENKFNAYFDNHYLEQATIHNLEFYAELDGKYYFILTRIAPSVHLKRVAIGGYSSIVEGKVTELVEVFRTWKRTPEELLPINQLLFEKMTRNEDLSDYYTSKMGLDAYIEFPNEEVWYDPTINTWVSSREDILKEFYDQKVQRTQRVIDSLEIQ